MNLLLCETRQMTTGEKVDHLRRLLKATCKVYYVSLGITQGECGPVTFSIHGTCRSHNGKSFVISKPAESFSDMLYIIIQSLQTINET